MLAEDAKARLERAAKAIEEGRVLRVTYEKDGHVFVPGTSSQRTARIRMRGRGQSVAGSGNYSLPSLSSTKAK
jgi:hypothetical protein